VQRVAADAVALEPRLGVGAAALRSAREVHHVVVLLQASHHGEALGVGRVVGRGREEAVPVLAPAGQVVEAVADVGDDAVEVDDGERAGHARSVPGYPSARIGRGTPGATVRARMPRVARSADSGMIGKMSASAHFGWMSDQS
jgi:hypothetical protein